jgi:hypothetical protein
MSLVLNTRPSGFPKVCKFLFVGLRLWVFQEVYKEVILVSILFAFVGTIFFTLLGMNLHFWWKIIYFVLSILTIILLVLYHRLEEKNNWHWSYWKFFHFKS